MRTIGMSDYTVGEDCFDELPTALAEYGATKVAIIGGKRALAAALPGIEAALAGTDVEILETRVYGTNSTRANIAKVVNSPACQEADVLIACGGGKALDTVKTAAIELKKIVFTVPTICSNCSAATAIAVVYNDDGNGGRGRAVGTDRRDGEDDLLELDGCGLHGVECLAAATGDKHVCLLASGGVHDLGDIGARAVGAVDARLQNLDVGTR